MKSENKTASEPRDFTTIMPTKSAEKGCGDTKKCSKCLKIKQLNEFYKKSEAFYREKDTPNSFRPVCKSCMIRTNNDNPNFNFNSRVCYHQNKQKVSTTRKEKRKINGSNTRAYFRKYYGNRRKNDVHFRLRNNLASRINRALKRNSKGEKTVELLGCSIPQLKFHLESQFVIGMSWDNYGDWHIDHRLPCASFDLSSPDAQKACFHYTNLQPLWAKDNLSKGDKIIY